jgi:predicted transposase YbfD/YdcC
LRLGRSRWHTITDGEGVAIDGKTLRRSHDRRNGARAIHKVSAWASANCLSLGQVTTAEKSNEITAIPQLLALLELKDCFETARARGFQGVELDTDEQSDAGHGRCEVRRCWVTEDLRTLPDPERGPGLRSIVMVEAERHVGDQCSREVRYYISSLGADAGCIARAVRAHWGIENQLHWALDVTFREDDSRVRRDHTPANLNTCRQFALNHLRRESSRASVKRKRLRAALNDAFRSKVIFGQ